MQADTLTIIQARVGSSRLPGKVLMPLCGAPLLVRMAERVMRATLKGTVVIATTTLPEDDAIEELCKFYDFNCYRGHPTDLLDRHYKAALFYQAKTVLKIPSDCPLIDPAIIDQTISLFNKEKGNCDFASNLHPPTYPDGNDVEVMSFAALEKAWKNATAPIEREHTTPYIWDNPQIFNTKNYSWKNGKDFSASHRWTIDHIEDYEFIKEVYNNLYPEKPDFGLEDILQFLDKQPSVAAINSQYAGQYWYSKHQNELKTFKVV